VDGGEGRAISSLVRLRDGHLAKVRVGEVTVGT
jgi:hypothetical protein